MFRFLLKAPVCKSLNNLMADINHNMQRCACALNVRSQDLKC